MTIEEAVRRSGLPASDAEVLLAAACGAERTWVLAHGKDQLAAERAELFCEWARRRRAREPVAYITGEKEFYGRTFAVDRRVLIPRPSTEILVSEALRFLDDPADRVTQADGGIVVVSRAIRDLGRVRVIVDVGTGSGCVAVTLALERSDLRCVATDISVDALAVARRNAARYGVEDRIDFRTGDELEPVADIAEPFLLVSNPPYVPDGRELPDEVALFEPPLALFGGPDGRSVTRSLADSAALHWRCCGVVVECLEGSVH